MGDEVEIQDRLDGGIEDHVSSDSQDDEPDPTLIKKEEIVEACKARDFDTLVSQATSEGGLLEDGLRKVVCKTIPRPSSP